MIAANHPSLGMSPHQSGDDGSPIFGPGVRSYFRPVPSPAPAPTPSPAPPPPPSEIQITPPVQTRPQMLTHIDPALVTEAAAAPAVPASAAATSPAPAAADTTTGTFDDFLNWLTEETVFPGYPNGLAFAGGVIGALWIFGGRKKGRR